LRPRTFDSGRESSVSANKVQRHNPRTKGFLGNVTGSLPLTQAGS